MGTSAERGNRPLKIAPFWWICKQPSSLWSDDDGDDYDNDDDDDDGVDEASGDNNGVENCNLSTDLQTKPNHFKTTFRSWCVQQTICG